MELVPLPPVRLETLPQDHPVAEEIYKMELKTLQNRLNVLQHRLAESARLPVILVFEGPDAAGKGGAIKRLVGPLDPRGVRVYSIGKPTPLELARHYLWRFWTKLPARGTIAVFDRSWYGRVLVERVEGFAAAEEWRRAYRELKEFERLLTDDGALLLKFYLQITPDEQLLRFQRREGDPAKRWKINAEDWRNREKWDAHNVAAEEMLARTNLAAAPWRVVAGNSKRHARLEILRTVATALEGRLAGVHEGPRGDAHDAHDQRRHLERELPAAL